MDRADQPDDFTTEVFFDQNPLRQTEAAAAGLAGITDVAASANAQVARQLARRWRGGCLERTAWSRHGHLATLSEDSTTIYLENLRYSQATMSWQMGPRHALTSGLDNAVSLAWSFTGGELAVVDVRGRIWVYHHHPLGLNRLVLARAGIHDDSNSEPIGMTWLNQDRQDRPRNVVTYATKGDTRWLHKNTKAKPLAPYWHRAVLVVHRAGLLTLCFQKLDGQYAKVSHRLASSDQASYTHAAFAPTVEGYLLIVLHSSQGLISACISTIDFTGPKTQADARPVIAVTWIPGQAAARPSSSPTSPGTYDPDSWALSHLAIIPTSDVEKAEQIPPTVVAVLTGMNRTVNSGEIGFLVSSTFRRWTATVVEPKLDPLFDDLPLREPSKSPLTVTYALLQQADQVERVTRSIHHVDGFPAMVTTTYDNRTQFFGSGNLSPLTDEGSFTETSSMTQSGFAFPFTPDLTFSPSFSPNTCVQAGLSPDGQTQLAVMEYGRATGQVHPHTLDPGLEVAVASVNLAFARAIWSNATFDDVLMCALQSLPGETHPMIVSNMYRTLFRDSEFVHEKTPNSELEKIFQKQVMGRVLAYHHSLTATCRDLPSILATEHRRGWCLSAQWAWLANNIRHTATLLFMNLREVQNASVPLSQDFTETLCANFRWGLAVIRFAVGVILEIGDRETDQEMFSGTDTGRFGDTKGDGSQGLVALLLNIHWSRIFMIAFIRAVRTYVTKLSEPRSRHQVQILQCIQQQTSGRGISFPAIETILEYRWSAQGDVEGDAAATAGRQLGMMATGIVHEAYQGTIKNMLSKLFNSSAGLRAKGLIDRWKLFTEQHDPEYLFLNPDVLGRREGAAPRSPIIYDVHRKRPISNGAPEPGVGGEPVVRRCVRCGSCSEDLVMPPRDWPKHVASLLARCVCDGNWVLDTWA